MIEVGGTLRAALGRGVPEGFGFVFVKREEREMVSAFVALLIAPFIFGFAGVSAVSAKECPLQVTPLPKDLQIEPLDPSVPPDFAQFHGVWSEGAWGDGALCNTLVVTAIDNDGNAKIVYSIGGS